MILYKLLNKNCFVKKLFFFKILTNIDVKD